MHMCVEFFNFKNQSQVKFFLLSGCHGFCNVVLVRDKVLPFFPLSFTEVYLCDIRNCCSFVKKSKLCYYY